MSEWNYIEECVDEEIAEIFKFTAIHSLSDYERRKIIFDHLTKTIDYDYDQLNKLIDAKLNGTKIKREPTKELLSVINANIGICNGISQYYKLLLERIGIPSHCVVVDDGTEINHQMLLVYNKETDTYSFDDVTSVIVKRGTSEEYFDYDKDKANLLGQGNRYLITGDHFTILPEEYFDYVTQRSIHPYQTLSSLPENISSVKKQVSKK